MALAVRGAEELSRVFDRIDADAIEAGVAKTKWRGRLERFDVGGAQVWVDGGHNEGAVIELVPWVTRSLGRPRTLVFGIMKDKDVEAVTGRLFPKFDHVIVTLADPERGCDTAQLAGLAKRLGVPCTVRSRPAAAVNAAIARGENTLVCGSLYLAGAAIPILDRRG